MQIVKAPTNHQKILNAVEKFDTVICWQMGKTSQGKNLHWLILWSPLLNIH